MIIYFLLYKTDYRSWKAIQGY